MVAKDIAKVRKRPARRFIGRSMHDCEPRLLRAGQALVGSRRPSEAPFRYFLEDLRSIRMSPARTIVRMEEEVKAAAPPCGGAAGASMVVPLVPAAAITPQFRVFRHLRRRQDASGRQMIFQMGFAQ